MKKYYHIWQHNLPADLLKPKYRNIVVYSAEEAEISDQFDPTKLKHKTITYIFGGADIDDYDRYTKVSKVKLWKDFFLYYAAQGLDIRNIQTEPVDKLFLSLNNKGHLHRCILQDLLCKHSLLDLGVYSWRNVEVEEYRFKYWKPKKRFLDQHHTKQDFHIHILPKEMNSCLINLVSESTTDKIFLTEKTFHPILIGKPFLAYGAPGIYKKGIRELGFKLHDNVFDYSFDDIQDDTERAEALVKELAKIKDKDYQLIELQLRDVAKFNKDHAFKLIRNQDSIPSMARKFKYYNSIIKEAVCKLDSLV